MREIDHRRAQERAVIGQVVATQHRKRRIPARKTQRQPPHDHPDHPLRPRRIGEIGGDCRMCGIDACAGAIQPIGLLRHRHRDDLHLRICHRGQSGARILRRTQRPRQSPNHPRAARSLARSACKARFAAQALGRRAGCAARPRGCANRPPKPPAPDRSARPDAPCETRQAPDVRSRPDAPPDRKPVAALRGFARVTSAASYAPISRS